MDVPPNFITRRVVSRRVSSGRVIVADRPILRERPRGFIPRPMAASNDPVSARKPQSRRDSSDQAAGPSIDPADVARFSAQAAEWWDARGPFAPLHKFNPSRLTFVRDRAAERFDQAGAGSRQSWDDMAGDQEERGEGQGYHCGRFWVW